MKRPSFQFYPGDWRRDAALQSCSVAARGLWLELMCVMHDCEPYGHLMVGAKAMQPAQLARLVGVSEKECRSLLAELEDAGVCSRTEAGVIYSRRMVRDEELRRVRADGGKAGSEHGHKGGSHGAKGGRPKKPKGGFEGGSEPPLEGDSKPPPSSSSSSSSALPPTDSGEFSTGVAPADAKPAAEPEVEPSVRLAIAARRYGIDCHGSDPRLIELAEQGVEPDVLVAACEKARADKPGERIGIGLVAAILGRWAADARRIDARGASPPKSSAHATFLALTGRSNTQREVIDVDAHAAALRLG